MTREMANSFEQSVLNLINTLKVFLVISKKLEVN